MSYIAAGDGNVDNLFVTVYLTAALQQPGVLTTESHRALT